MCLGIPMQVMEIDAASGGTFAWCEGVGMDGTPRRERLNVLWLGEVAVGEWVFATLGQARERLSEERARDIARALSGLSVALREGVSDASQLDNFFPDLVQQR